MASESSLRLPVIDFSEINDQLKSSPTAAGADDHHHWNSVRSQVMEALDEYGCFEVVYDCSSKVSSELHEQQISIYAAAEEVFNLPAETKVKNIFPATPYRGYNGNIPLRPLYESMGINEPHILEKAESFIRLMWPEGNENICKVLHLYGKQVIELDQMVRRMILESLGVEKYYKEHIESTEYVLKLIKYQAPETNEVQVGLGKHTDMNMVTILTQINHVNGLEVETKTGEWIKVKPSPNSFTVMIGDAMMAWTNGRLSPPLHQVMMTGDETRYATGLFSVPREGCLIKTPKELVDEEHPLLYKPYYHDDFIAHILKVNGPERSKLVLKEFCGV